MTLALPGVALVHLATRPERPMILASLLLALTNFLAFIHACSSVMEILLLAGASVGIGCFLSLAWMALATASPRDRSFAPFGAAAILLAFCAAVGLFFRLTVILAPTTYDIALYQFDQSFGFQSSFLVGQLLSALPLLKGLAHGAYVLVSAAIAAMYALQLRTGKPASGNIILPFATAAAVGWVLYLVYPAAGPIYAFGDLFPANPPATSGLHLQSLALPAAARNCMPSLHMAWALLILWNSRAYGRPIRVLAAALLVLTILATLGLGEHYAIDLVVAVPFAMAVEAACTTSVPLRRRVRLAPLVTGAALTSAWIIGLKLGFQSLISSPSVCWTLVAATVIPSILLEKRLAWAALGKLPVGDASIGGGAARNWFRVVRYITPVADR